MNDLHLHDTIKTIGGLCASWLGFFATIELADISLIVSICAGLGSVTVSIFTVRWIRKQMAGYDQKKSPTDFL
jgi:hypothetical protein